MSCLKDMHLSDVQPGSLVYPSSSARRSGNGGYRFEGETRCVKDDSEIFPAIAIDPFKGLLVTPTGVKAISRHCLIAVEK